MKMNVLKADGHVLGYAESTAEIQVSLDCDRNVFGRDAHGCRHHLTGDLRACRQGSRAKGWRVAQAFDLAGHSQHNGCAVLRVLCEGRETEMAERTVDHATLRQVRCKLCGMTNEIVQASSQPTPSASSGQALAKNARMGHPLWEWHRHTSLKIGHPPRDDGRKHANQSGERPRVRREGGWSLRVCAVWRGWGFDQAQAGACALQFGEGKVAPRKLCGDWRFSRRLEPRGFS